MKAKFGWAVGVNVAVACLVMQGCKNPRVADPNYGNEVKTVEQAPQPAPADDISVAPTVAQAPQQQPQQAPEVKVEEAPAPQPEVVPLAQTAPQPAAYTLYTVKPGDMLSKISRRYNIRQKAILDLNPGLQPNKLYAGRKIKLPGEVAVDAPAAAPAAVPAVAAPAPAAGTAASVKPPKAAKAVKYTGATSVYVVKNGDSLGKIAHANGTNIRTLKEINALKSDRVFIGQKLKVPVAKADAKDAKDAKDAAKAAPAKEAKDKAVAKKDKPAAAQPKQDKAASAAEAAAPAPAAETAAPAPAAEAAQPAAEKPAETAAAAPAPAAEAAQPAPVRYEIHTVKEGEDVVSIAISYGIGPGELLELNGLKGSDVKPGQQLKIPVKNAQ